MRAFFPSKRAPGERPGANEILATTTIVTIGVVSVLAGFASIIALTVKTPAMAISILVGAGIVALTSFVSWVIMVVIDRHAPRAQGVVMFGSYVVKLMILLGVLAVFSANQNFHAPTVLVSFVLAIIVQLAVTSVVILSGPGPAIGE